MHATLTATSPYFAAALGGPTEPPAALLADEPALQSIDTLDSRDLLQGRKTVSISHNGTLYRLQATRLGKLILTK